MAVGLRPLVILKKLLNHQSFNLMKRPSRSGMLNFFGSTEPLVIPATGTLLASCEKLAKHLGKLTEH